MLLSLVLLSLMTHTMYEQTNDPNDLLTTSVIC